MHKTKIDLRAEYRLSQRDLEDASPDLNDKFPDLKSLKMEVEYSDGTSTRRISAFKQTFNLAMTKSIFSFACPNQDCAGGDFDLSQVLAAAVGATRIVAAGELRCHGMRNVKSLPAVPCNNLMRY